MDTTIREQNHTDSEQIEITETEIPDFYEVTDTEENETIGYVSAFCGQLTFYPKAGQAYSGTALNAINEKCQQLLNS